MIKQLVFLASVAIASCFLGGQPQPPNGLGNGLGSLGGGGLGINNGLGGINIEKKKKEEPKPVPVPVPAAKTKEEMFAAKQRDAFKKIRGVKNLDDFLRAFKPADHEPRTSFKTIRKQHSIKENVISTASGSNFIQMSTGGSTEVVEIPRVTQHCTVRQKIVDLDYLVPEMSREMVWPGCVTVNECSGCCDPPFVCKPTQTRDKNVGVFYVDNNFQYRHITRTLTEHTQCTCGCKISASDCVNLQSYNQEWCTCECNVETQVCSAGEQWSNIYCGCVRS